MAGGYRWNDIPLKVMVDPPPTLIPTPRWIVSRPPGYRGASARIPNGEEPTTFSCTILTTNHAEKLTLQAAFARHAEGPLEVPRCDGSGESDVYESAFVERSRWQPVLDGRRWTCQVEFLCPDPLPRCKSTGNPAY